MVKRGIGRHVGVPWVESLRSSCYSPVPLFGVGGNCVMRSPRAVRPVVASILLSCLGWTVFPALVRPAPAARTTTARPAPPPAGTGDTVLARVGDGRMVTLAGFRRA